MRKGKMGYMEIRSEMEQYPYTLCRNITQKRPRACWQKIESTEERRLRFALPENLAK